MYEGRKVEVYQKESDLKNSVEFKVGTFCAWSLHHEKVGELGATYPTAVIEFDDGTVSAVDIKLIKFIKKTIRY